MIRNPYPSFGVLLVDDESSFLRSVSLLLERMAGITNTACCQDSRDVMSTLAGGDFGLVLLDLTMPHLSGENLLEMIATEHPDIAVIVVSGMNQIDTAVNCMKKGAFDYVVKTSEDSQLVQGVQRAIAMLNLSRENQKLRERFLSDTLEHPEAFAAIVTTDKAMRAVFQYIESTAPSRQPILITGESGVGKELIAAAIHRLSRVTGPLVAVNASGLDDHVFADTLFGHVKGSFTGADQARQGLVEQAAGGTLFLDEIGELSAQSQLKLLRLLQEGEYYPLGCDRPKRMLARIVAATHCDLYARQADGRFRKDLFYRLRTHHVHIPALRERRADIPLLFYHFLRKTAAEQNKKSPTIPRELPILLANYAFPGNVRELKAMVVDAVSVHRSRMLGMEIFKRRMDSSSGTIRVADTASPELQPEFFANTAPLPALHDVAYLLIAEAMRRAQNNQSIAARLIGISQPALSKRLKKMKS